MTDYSELVARLREQADDVLDPGYPFYGTPELVREAADALEAHGRKISELIGMREEVLHYQREFHRMRDKLAEAEALADKWHMMERPYIGGYEKGPNPSYLCRHRYRLADCITCLNEHLATEQKP